MRKGDELIAFYKEPIEVYPVILIEDSFDRDDWSKWSKFTKEVEDKVHIIEEGDSTVANLVKIRQAVEQGLASYLLLKMDQIDSTSKSFDAVKPPKQSRWGVVTSHLLRETEDSYMDGLAMGLCTGQIKRGASGRWRICTSPILPWDFVQARSRQEHLIGGRESPSTISS